jgi:hypothetical protein
MRDGSGEDVLQMAVEERFEVGLDCRVAWRDCCGSLGLMIECIMTGNSGELCQVRNLVWNQIQPNNQRERVHKHFQSILFSIIIHTGCFKMKTIAYVMLYPSSFMLVLELHDFLLGVLTPLKAGFRRQYKTYKACHTSSSNCTY